MEVCTGYERCWNNGWQEDREKAPFVAEKGKDSPAQSGRGASGPWRRASIRDGHFWAQFQDWCGHGRRPGEVPRTRRLKALGRWASRD